MAPARRSWRLVAALASLAWGLGPATTARAQSGAAPVRLEPVVVTATRLPTPISRVAGAVTVLGAEDLARRQARTVAEALATVPGLRVVRSGPAGQQTSVFIRGASSSHTLVLIDGIRANDPSSPTGAFDFSGLTLENVERIEIVRGPLSTLYGSDAVGGVVQIMSRRGSRTPRASARLEVGSRDTVDLALGASGPGGALEAGLYRTAGESVTPERLRAGAPGERDGHRAGSAAGRARVQVSEALDLSLLGRYLDTRTDLDPGPGEDPDARIDQRQAYLRGEAHASLAAGRWDSTLALDYSRHDRDNRNDPQGPFDTRERSSYRGERTALRWQNDVTLPRGHLLSAGAEVEREQADSRSALDLGGLPVAARTDAAATTRALFLQDAFDLGETLLGSAGVRLDHHQDFGSALTWRVAVAHTLASSATRLTASVGTGFKAPSLDQLYGVTVSAFGLFRGNPDLEPERSLGWELGLEQSLAGGAATLGAMGFASRIEDLIALAFLPSGDSTLENREEAEISGVEAFARLAPAGGWQVRVDYTYTDARDGEGLRLLRRPRHQAGLTADWDATRATTVSLRAIYVDDWEDVDRVTFERVRPAGYGTIDLAVRHALGPRLSLLGRIENLLDDAYEPASGFAGPRRAVFVGLEAAL
jgi:vitamin B12 transporter